jgi:hypothetical protein
LRRTSDLAAEREQADADDLPLDLPLDLPAIKREIEPGGGDTILLS